MLEHLLLLTDLTVFLRAPLAAIYVIKCQGEFAEKAFLSKPSKKCFRTSFCRFSFQKHFH